MEKNAPENVFGIADESNISSANKGSGMESSENKSEENIVPENKEMTLDDLKAHLQKNNITINEDNIQNYYNQIVENKKYVTEYNQTIKKLEEDKKEFSNKTEEGKIGEDSNKLITSKISQIEKQLADLNVEKQKKEDNIKSTINNIFNENKTENSKNVNFETKNTILNMALNDQKSNVVEAKEQEKDIEKESTPKEEVVKEEEGFLNAPKEDAVKEEEEFLNAPKEEAVKEKKEFLSTPKEEAVKEKKEFLSTPKEEVVKDGVSDVPLKETSNTNQNPISNMEKVDSSSVPSKSEEKTKETGSDVSSLSEEMRKGFESVLNAIQGINKGSSEAQKEKPQETSETPKQPQPQGASDAQDKPKTPQKNYIEEDRESLRSNAPINGFVGIKGLELKANNIGSYL